MTGDLIQPLRDLALWIGGQSDTVKAAALAALIAVLGIIINGIVTHWNTGRQLRHDREQKAAERKLVLRRDIYLGLAEHLQDAVGAVVGFADLQLEHKDIVRAWQKASQFAAKINVMAGPELLDAVSRVNVAVRSAVLRIRADREKLLSLKRTLERHEARRAMHMGAANSAYEAIRRRGIEGSLSGAEIERLGRIAHSEETEAEKIGAQVDVVMAQLSEGRGHLIRDAFAEQKAIYPHLIPVVAAIRRELKEEIDLSVYQKILDRVEGAGSKKELAALYGEEKPNDAHPKRLEATE